MKNPSLEPDKDKWEIQRGGNFDGLRTPLRPMQAGNPDAILNDLRLRIHRRLIDTLDLAKLSTLEMESVKVEIRRILEDMVMAEAIPLSRADRDRLVSDVQHEVFGLGPLETLMKDPEIADILVNTHSHVFVERYGKLEKKNEKKNKGMDRKKR
jgi:pilus assembly protein CpaF